MGGETLISELPLLRGGGLLITIQHYSKRPFSKTQKRPVQHNATSCLQLSRPLRDTSEARRWRRWALKVAVQKPTNRPRPFWVLFSEFFMV